MMRQLLALLGAVAPLAPHVVAGGTAEPFLVAAGVIGRKRSDLVAVAARASQASFLRKLRSLIGRHSMTAL